MTKFYLGLRVILMLVAFVEPRTLKKVLLPHNLALQKTTSQSTFSTSFENSYRAVDGNSNSIYTANSCTHTVHDVPGHWWRVDLGGEYLMYEVHIQNRADCCAERLEDVDILVGTTVSSFQRCHHFDGPGGPLYYQFQCASPLHGRYVKVAKHTISALTLCEVLVLGTHINGDLPFNLALGQQTNNSFPNGADGTLSVDGNGSPEGALCTQIDSVPDQWWTVDLGRNYRVRAVGVQNRGDCCGAFLSERDLGDTCDLLANLDVFVGMEGGTFQLCGHYDGPGADAEYVAVTCIRGLRGRYVKIVKYGGALLTLCEVHVFGGFLFGEFVGYPGEQGISSNTVQLVGSSFQCAINCIQNSDCEGYNVRNTGGSAECELLLETIESAESSEWTLYQLP